MIGKSINKIIFYISKGVGFIIGYTYRRLFGPLSKNDKGDISKNEDDKNQQLSKENKLPLKKSEKEIKNDKFILKKDEFLRSNKNRE